MKRFDPGLNALLRLLEERAIPVGLTEISRLEAVFALTPQLDGDGLRQVLEAILVKSLEEREVFRLVYNRWMRSTTQQIEALEAEKQEAEARKEQARERQGAPGAAGSFAPPAVGPAPLSPPQPASLAPGAVPQPGAPGERTLTFVAPPVQAPPLGDLLQQQESGVELPRQAEQWLAQPASASRGGPKRGGKGLFFSLAALALLGLGIFFAVWYLASEVGTGKPTTNDGDGGVIETTGSKPIDNPGLGPHALFRRPTIELVDSPTNWHDLVALILAVVALGAGLVLGLRCRGRWLPRPRRRRDLPFAALLIAPGAPPGVSLGDTLYLDEHDEENLVWGVGRFISQEETRDLDIDRTVDETAGAYGRPVLRFQHARYQREVWLWVDESLESPAARHLSGDLARLLERSGLPVMRAEFWGIPAKLRTESDEVLIVDTLDARRDAVAVAILTDGRLMSTAMRARDRRNELDRLLETLSHWPRVTFIDFGREPRQLPTILAPYGLRTILPRDASAAVSDLAAPDMAAEYRELTGDARVWAAACALSPRPVDDRSALALRRILGLEVTPWVIEAMRDQAASTAGGISWSAEKRAALLDWLTTVEDVPEDLGKRARQGLSLASRTVKLPPGALLDRVTDAWRQVLHDREHALSRQDPGWADSRAGQELLLERAFIHLWDTPNRSAAALFELYASGLFRDTIRQNLVSMAGREAGSEASPPDRGDPIIFLPWRLDNLPRSTQVRLAEMGFAARAGTARPPRSMPRPGRLLLAIAACIGLSSGLVAGLVGERRNEALFNTDADAWRAARGYVSLDPCQEGWCLIARMPLVPSLTGSGEVTTGERGQAETVIPPGKIAKVRWDDELPLPCKETIDTERGAIQIMRCDTSDQRAVKQKDRWSFAVIYVPDEGKQSDFATEVAGELLDSGSVDGVYLLDDEAALALLPLADLARPRDEDDFAVPGGGDYRDQLLVLATSIPDLPGYTGRAVVWSSDGIGALIGITDDFTGTATLAQRLVAYQKAGKTDETRDLLSGSPGDFLLHGRGSCGSKDERCCSVIVDGEECKSAALECQDGRCVALPRICEPDSDRRCSEDNLVEVCNESGTGWEQGEYCGKDACVAGECRPVLCERGASVCIDDRTAGVCDSTGTAWQQRIACGRDICIAGQCQTPRCKPGERRCTDNQEGYVVCDETRADWRAPVTCSGNRVCVDGQCVARQCKPDAIESCGRDGKSFTRCNALGTDEERVPCAPDALCRGRACQAIRGARIEFSNLRIGLPRLRAQDSNAKKAGGQGTSSEIREREALFALRCTVTGGGTVKLALDLASKSPSRLVAPYSARSKGFVVSCDLSFNGNPVGSSSARHPFNLSSEGSHDLTIPIKLDRVPRLPIDYKREDLNISGLDVRVVYDVAIQLVEAEAEDSPDNSPEASPAER